ncbi:MAG: triose-phosphate isomerase [Bacteroidetes bacterium]|nr:MAG: triose-phosphate isomerase [Bacteroidota bacterium]
MRKQIAAANWKMNLTLEQADALVTEISNHNRKLGENHVVVFAVPFPYLIWVSEKTSNMNQFHVAAQNCYTKKSGAYTGEVSAEMLNSIGIKWVVLGHSERREYFGETNQMLSEKLNLALEYHLTPIFCCGEPLPIREAGTQNQYVEQQLRESLFGLSAEQIQKIVIAYEPIWAIGTGKTATSAQAQEMHAHLRKILASKFGDKIADGISILYGGSVKASNAKEIFSQPDVDGGLVGGASLIATEFNTIIDSLK